MTDEEVAGHVLLTMMSRSTPVEDAIAKAKEIVRKHRLEALEEGFRAGCVAFEGKSQWADVESLWQMHLDDMPDSSPVT